MKRTIIIAALAALALSACNIQYSDGFRVGVVQKCSQKGLFYKTFEGELVVEGIKNTQQGAISNVWAFSANDKKVADAISAAANAGQRVKLYYTQYALNSPSIGDTGYLVTRVETVK